MVTAANITPDTVMESLHHIISTTTVNLFFLTQMPHWFLLVRSTSDMTIHRPNSYMRTSGNSRPKGPLKQSTFQLSP